MPIRAIAYTSEALPGFDLVAVEKLAQTAAAFNMHAGVTGLLLFDGARFLQYLEGPEDGIAVVFSRILNSQRHTNLVELGRASAGRRFFPYWSMRMLPAPPEELQLSAKTGAASWCGRRLNRVPAASAWSTSPRWRHRTSRWLAEALKVVSGDETGPAYDPAPWTPTPRP
jgi:hypothetical protein